MYILKDFIHEGKTYKAGTSLDESVRKDLGEYHITKMVQFLSLYDPSKKITLRVGDRSRSRRLLLILRDLGFDKSEPSPDLKPTELKPEPSPDLKSESLPETVTIRKKKKRRGRKSLEEAAGVSK